MPVLSEAAPLPSSQTDSVHWGDTTDPSSHDPNNFRYLVHGMSVRGTASMAEAYEGINRDSYGLTDEAVAAQRTDLLSTPEQVQKRITMSTSLIDAERRHTWNEAGIILGVPEEDVLITAPRDVGTIHGNRDWIERHNERLRLA
jgi:hypothetical protein